MDPPLRNAPWELRLKSCANTQDGVGRTARAVMPALGSLRRQDPKFKSSLNHTVSP